MVCEKICFKTAFYVPTLVAYQHHVVYITRTTGDYMSDVFNNVTNSNNTYYFFKKLLKISDPLFLETVLKGLKCYHNKTFLCQTYKL